MAALDTNVLVRYLVLDDPRQLAAARRLIDSCVAEGLAVFVPVTVSLELEWVLRSRFGFSKAQVIARCSDLLSAIELSFESEGALEHALLSYAQGKAEFSDYVHVALAVQAGEQPLWTFDRSAARATGARLIV